VHTVALFTKKRKKSRQHATPVNAALCISRSYKVLAVAMNEEIVSRLSLYSEFELAELILMTISTGIEQLNQFLTVLFAYFLVAYLVGKKLSSFQLFAITFVYSVFSFIAVFAFAGLQLSLLQMLEFRDGVSLLPWFAPPLTCFAAWMLSIIFMIHSRRRGDT
jgi:hypothetical protein